LPYYSLKKRTRTTIRFSVVVDVVVVVELLISVAEKTPRGSRHKVLSE